jgi:succinate dehydrogenase / fumarate reductase cytochrome b subunit
MDAGYWEEIESGHAAAKATLIIAVVAILLAGVWIW